MPELLKGVKDEVNYDTCIQLSCYGSYRCVIRGIVILAEEQPVSLAQGGGG